MLIIGSYYRPSADITLVLESLCAASGAFHVDVSGSKLVIGLGKSDQIFHNRSKCQPAERLQLNYDAFRHRWFVSGFKNLNEARSWCYMSRFVEDLSGLLETDGVIIVEVSDQDVKRCLL